MKSQTLLPTLHINYVAQRNYPRKLKESLFWDAHNGIVYWILVLASKQKNKLAGSSAICKLEAQESWQRSSSPSTMVLRPRTADSVNPCPNPRGKGKIVLQLSSQTERERIPPSLPFYSIWVHGGIDKATGTEADSLLYSVCPFSAPLFQKYPYRHT